jgi:type IV secretory pathway VirB10-like protein
VVFNEAKMTYKNPVEKSELLLDLSYLGYENDDPFQPVKNDDEDDQSVKIDQSMRERENSDSENSENSDHQEENLTETAPPADSPTEVQPVGGNLTPPPADSSQPVRVDQTAPLHAAEDDDELSILVSDPEPAEQEEPNEMTNQQGADNRLISEENNPLILNYPRSKIRHDYKQLHHRGFVKAAKKIEPIESPEHGLVTPKTFEQAINGPQAKE